MTIEECPLRIWFETINVTTIVLKKNKEDFSALVISKSICIVTVT